MLDGHGIPRAHAFKAPRERARRVPPPRKTRDLGRVPMKKILMGLTAVFALSVAVPAFAGEEKKEEPAKKEDAKPKKPKKEKKAEKEEK